MRDSTVLAGTTPAGIELAGIALDGTVLIGTTPAGTAPAGTTTSPSGLIYVVRSGQTGCAPLHGPARHATPHTPHTHRAKTPRMPY